MTLDAFTIAIFTIGVLAGMAVAVLAVLAPDVPQALRDLRHRPNLPADDRTALQVERAVSRRVYRTLSLLGILAVLIAGLSALLAL